MMSIAGSKTILMLIFAMLLAALLPVGTHAAAPTIASLSPTSGPIGTSVTITGTNFGASQGTSTVKFNGVTVTPCGTCWASTSIQVTIPSGLTTGNVVVNVGGVNSNGVNFTVTALPTNWADADVGAVGVAGSGTFANGTFNVAGAGNQVWGTADGMNFTYQSLSGDGTIIARLSSFPGSTTFSQAGLMIRETLSPGAANFFTANQNASAYITDRVSTGASTSYFSGPSAGLPSWLKLVRSGNTFSGYSSTDGITWTQMSTTKTITMAQSVYIGLAVSSGSTTALATAKFDNVAITSNTLTPPMISSLSATTGSIGSQVVITGSGFGTTQAGSTVYLNGAPVPVNSWAATSITISIPTGATTGPFVVSVVPSMNDSNAVQFEVTTQPLPQPWLNQDVGPVALQGSATFANGSFTLNGAGRGIYNSPDQFQFVYQTLTGDGSIVARVSNIQGSQYTQAGVMIRETLTGNADYAFVFYNPNTTNLYYRTNPGGSTSYQSNSLTAPAYPYWVRLDRNGSTFTSYASADGVYWVPVGSQSFTMAETVSIGLAVSSESVGSLSTVTFDNVSLNTTASPAPTISMVSATTGSIGSQITLYGSGFGASQGGSFVSLNGSAVSINSWSDTAITITIPTGATSGLLSVTVAPSMNNSNTVWFTITTQPLAAAWLDIDIGNVGLRGSATYSNGTFTIKGAGQQIWGTQDGFHFVYQPLSGDGTIIARVSNIQGPANPQVGVMIRETTLIASTNAFVYFQPNTANLDSRVITGGNSNQQYTSFGNCSYPYWVKLVRSGNVFTGYISADGTNWTLIATQTIVMSQNVFIGMAVSSESTTALTTGSFDSVSISSDLLVPPTITGVSATTGNVGAQVNIFGRSFGPNQGSSMVVLNGSPVTIASWSDTAIGVTIPTGATTGFFNVLLGPSRNSSNPVLFTVTSQPLPSGWLDTDIGPSVAGSATYSGGTFTVNASGTGMTGTADGLHFVYTSLSGNGVVIARVTNATGTISNRQAGIMIRESLSPGSTNAFVSYIPNQGFLTDRVTTGGSTTSVNTSFVGPAFPYWAKLARIGNTFSAYLSPDGSTWTQVGTTQTITMAQTVYVGLGLSSALNGNAITATFDNVSITPGTMPTISGVTPASGGIGASVTVNGSNFGSSQGGSSVKFNGTPATSITSWASNKIVAIFPTAGTSGPVTVVVNSITSNTDFGFTLYHPVLSSLSPPVGQVNATIIVAGSGFGAYQATGSQVLFNQVSASVLNWSDTSIKVYVPPGATSGPLGVTVGGVTSNTIQFSVEPLSVTGISPNTASVGTPITVTGTGFGAAQYSSSVDFNGIAANIQSWSDTQIVAIVPPGTVSGSVNVTVGSITWYGPLFTIAQTVRVTDSKNNQTNYTMALIGGVWGTTSSQGSGCSTCTERGNISYSFDSSGHPLSRTDENGNTVSYTYDSNGNILTVTVPISAGHTATTTYTYNSLGEVLTATDPLGNVTTNTYDSKGNLLTVTTPAPGGGPAASVTTFGYNGLGELTSIKDPLGNQTTIAYFPTGQIQTITDAKSNVTTYAYDTQGNRTSVTDANQKQTTFAYDAMNRLTKITYPDTTFSQFGYDIRGRRTTVTDQNNKITTYGYDDADRLITVTDAASPANVTTYGYDSESNLTSIKDANNNTTAFDYDAFRRVTKTTFPSTHVETYGYDNAGNLSSKTDRKNQQITYTYDQLNRLTQKSYPDTTTVNYTYDNDSRLTQVSDPTGTYTFTFDNMGRLTGTTTNYAFLTGRSFTTAYGYDAGSNRTSFTDPENGATAYVYDTLNRLQTLTPPAAISAGSFGFGYDALSRRTSLTRPNNVNTAYGYDNLSRLLSVTHANGGTTLDGAAYTVDNAGNRLTRTPQPSGTASTFGYDNIYQLLSVTQGSTTTESYTYDAVGNRLSNLTTSGWSNNTSNELTSRPGVTYTYDLNGNTQTKVDATGTTTYTWDYENRLTSVTLPGTGGTVTFKYDPFGRRIYKSSSSGTSIYAYDGDNLIEETNSSGAVVARYSQTENVDEPLAMLRSSTTSYYHADGLGSITSLSNTAGALAQTYTFDSFGKQTASSGSLTNPFRFTARDFDSETNLQFSRARYYDPNTGRFLSEDPLAFGGGINFYAYVGNDSTNFTDPSGLECKPQCFAQLKYRPTDLTKPNGMTHAFWYVQGSDGHQFIVEGGPTTPTGGSLNVWPPRRTGNGDPVLLAPVWWNSGLSSANCDGVDNLLKAAGAWPQNTIPYWWQGPNSNGAAKSLGAAGGFSPTAPPNSTGWGVPMPRPNNH